MQVNYTTILSLLESFLLHYCVNLSTTLLLLHRNQYKEVVSTRFAPCHLPVNERIGQNG